MGKKEVQDDGFQSVKQKTNKGGNCESQGERQGSGFNNLLMAPIDRL